MQNPVVSCFKSWGFFFQIFPKAEANKLQASNNNSSVQHAESYEFKLQLIYYKCNQPTLVCCMDVCMTLTFKGNSALLFLWSEEEEEEEF